jgi:hypothetical protein
MHAETPWPMTEADFAWAAQLMQRRRELYAEYSPVFWRPAQGVLELHAYFLRVRSEREGALALRTRGGFVVSSPLSGRCTVDDFAVEEPSSWPSEGRALLLAAWQRARSPAQTVLEVVTGRRDEPKRRMLADLGLSACARWWVKELDAAADAQPHGPITVAGTEAQLLVAPPVYAPGGPVCLTGDLDPGLARAAAADAAAAGAVLLIVRRDGGDSEVPASEPELEAAGFHNPSEFYRGCP